MYNSSRTAVLHAGAQAHQRLGKPTIRCRIQKANQQALRMHLM